MACFTETYTSARKKITFLSNLVQSHINDLSLFKASLLVDLFDLDNAELMTYAYSNSYFDYVIAPSEFPEASLLTSYLNSPQRLADYQIAVTVLQSHGLLQLDKDQDAMSLEYLRDALSRVKYSNISTPGKLIATAWNDLRENGYCVIPGVLDKALCDRYREIILEKAKIDKSTNNAFLYGRKKDFQRIYHLLVELPELNHLVVEPTVLNVLDLAFRRPTWHDRYYLCSWHANIVPPGGEAQKAHVDTAVPDPLPNWTIRMNTNFLLQDYHPDNGATMIRPGSHLCLSKPHPDDNNGFISISAKKGDLVIWNGHVWHKSGTNNTSVDRVALLGTYTASFMREMCLEEDNLRYATMNGVKLDDTVLDVLGEKHGIKR